jgi:hypothetical protein
MIIINTIENATSQCWLCCTDVENTVNGWVEYFPEENQTECMCDECSIRVMNSF